MKLAKKKLSEKGCAPCQSATAPLKGVALKKLSNKLGSGWKVVKGHHLEREYKFKDFLGALKFTNSVGKLAEKVQHHPDIYLAWACSYLELFSRDSLGTWLNVNAK
jgi:4a-hydroxytetrahydrobiopterin dehydratase